MTDSTQTPSPVTSARVLCVDDNLTTRRLVQLYLKGTPYQVIHAENGIEALEKLAEGQIDLILTDINMPLMDGVELVKSVKVDPEFSKIPVIFLTTEDSATEKARGMSSGADRYITKPVTRNILVTTIEDVLRHPRT